MTPEQSADYLEAKRREADERRILERNAIQRAAERQARRVKARTPMYHRAIVALMQAAERGEDLAICWVRELAPLDKAERASCREEVAKMKIRPPQAEAAR